ncbi:hypothetical protein [Arthrobacter sp. MMS24-S77]
MANNALQIVLNSGSFVDDVQTTAMGSNTDFFAHRDQEFGVHKAGLINQFSAAKASLASSGHSTGFARVALRPAALAKSHRPTRSILKPDALPVCGVSDFGELLVEFTTGAVDDVIRSIEKAEPETRLKSDKSGKAKPSPSRIRSEVGAISQVTPYGASDRRQFSLDEAIAWLSDPRSGRCFLIQMFVPVPELARSESGRRVKGFADFQRRLKVIDDSLVLAEVTDWWSERGFLRLSMGKGDLIAPAELFRRVLSVLEDEPFVRKIWLPSIIEPTDHSVVEISHSGDHHFEAPVSDSSYPIVGIIDTGIAAIDPLEPWIVGRTAAGDPASQDASHGTFIGALISDAQRLNGHAEAAESPCKIYDLGLHITEAQGYAEAYPNGFMDFLEQLDFEIESAVAAGARVLTCPLWFMNSYGTTCIARLQLALMPSQTSMTLYLYCQQETFLNGSFVLIGQITRIRP